MTKVYLLSNGVDHIHSFVASDNHAAACVVRSMIDRTIYGYRTECVIASCTAGFSKPERPKLFDAIKNKDLLLERIFDASDTPVVVYDPLLDPHALIDLVDDTMYYVDHLEEVQENA